MNKKVKIFFIFIILLVVLGILYINQNKYEEVIDILDKEYIVLEKENIKKIKDTSSLNPLPNIEKRVRISATGDAIFHMPQVEGAKTQTGYDFNNSFKYINDLIKDSDLNIVNFETTAYGNEKGFSGYPAFHSPVETIDALKNTGFNIFNLNNNHSLDRGIDGLLGTLNAVKKRDIDVIGSNGQNESKSLVKTINDVRVGFISYSYGYNGNEARYKRSDLDKIINFIDNDKIKEDIKELKKETDFIISYIHWGNEYEPKPNQEQINLANMMFEEGVDVIFGSHPHVIQRNDLLKVNGKDKYVIYSLGNFISNQRIETINKPRTEDGVIVKLDLVIDNKGNKKIENINHIPTWVNKYGNTYEVIPIEKALNKEININNYNNIENRLIDSLNRTNNLLRKDDIDV